MKKADKVKPVEISQLTPKIFKLATSCCNEGFRVAKVYWRWPSSPDFFLPAMDLVDTYSNSSPATTPAHSPPTSPVPPAQSPDPVVDEGVLAGNDAGPDSRWAATAVAVVREQPDGAVKLVTGTVEAITFDNDYFAKLERSLDTTGTTRDPGTGNVIRPKLTSNRLPTPAAPTKRLMSSRPDTAKPASGSAKSKHNADAPRKRPRPSKLSDPFMPTSELHLPSSHDYQNRAWSAPPPTARTFSNLETYVPYIPKRVTHTVTAHRGGLSSLSFTPRFGHLLLTTGNDHAARIWNLDTATAFRTYHGHTAPVRDAAFSPLATTFLTGGYDRAIRLWDTETGRVIGSYATSATPYCVRFSPPHNGTEFLAACGDKRVIQFDTRDASKIVQSYDQHMGPVNSITFIDDDRRFVSSSDDKVLRLWDYGTPVVIRYISDPSAHSMPITMLHPNRKWLACQSMDNSVRIFSVRDKFKPNHKKVFNGHLVAGYSCGLTTSPDGRFLASGDSLGRIFFWDWKTSRLLRAVQAHEGVSIALQWHPTRPSFLVTGGWDGKLKFWD